MNKYLVSILTTGILLSLNLQAMEEGKTEYISLAGGTPTHMTKEEAEIIGKITPGGLETILNDFPKEILGLIKGEIKKLLPLDIEEMQGSLLNMKPRISFIENYGFNTNSLRVWDANDQIICELAPQPTYDTKTKKLCIYDANDQVIHEFTIQPTSEEVQDLRVTSIALSHNGKYCAVGIKECTAESLIFSTKEDFNDEIRIYDLENKTVAYTLTCSRSNRQVAWGPFDKYIISADSDVYTSISDDSKEIVVGNINIWDLRTKQIITSIPYDKSEVKQIASSPNDKYIATTSADAKVKIYNLHNGALITCIEDLTPLHIVWDVNKGIIAFDHSSAFYLHWKEFQDCLKTNLSLESLLKLINFYHNIFSDNATIAIFNKLKIADVIKGFLCYHHNLCNIIPTLVSYDKDKILTVEEDTEESRKAKAMVKDLISLCLDLRRNMDIQHYGKEAIEMELQNTIELAKLEGLGYITEFLKNVEKK